MHVRLVKIISIRVRKWLSSLQSFFFLQMSRLKLGLEKPRLAAVILNPLHDKIKDRTFSDEFL